MFIISKRVMKCIVDLGLYYGDYYCVSDEFKHLFPIENEKKDGLLKKLIKNVDM